MWNFRNTFVELAAPQRSPGWFRARNRITASVYESALDLSPFTTGYTDSNGKTLSCQEEAIGRILGKIPPKEENEEMRIGKEQEPFERKWFARTNHLRITHDRNKLREEYCSTKSGLSEVPFADKVHKGYLYEPSLCLPLRWYDFPMQWKEDKLLSSFYPSQLEDPLHPNWFIGGSPDGEISFSHRPDSLESEGFPFYQFRQPGFSGFQKIYDANLEIKFPKGMYLPLLNHFVQIHEGQWEDWPRYTTYHNTRLSQPFLEEIRAAQLPFTSGVIDHFPHIWRSHFMQMQGCMAITGRKHCIYQVGSFTEGTPERPDSKIRYPLRPGDAEGTPERPDSKIRYVEVVPFDEKYWRYFLYPSLVEVVETKLKPAMSEKQLQDFTEDVRRIIEIVPKSAEVRIPFSFF